MDLMEAVKNHRGNPFWIPNCTRDDLPKLFIELGFKKGVEVGVCWAENLLHYCKAGLEIYGVDPWSEHSYRKIVSIPGEHAKTNQAVYEWAKERTSLYPNCTLIRKPSFEAVEDFGNASLDFVYIDGNHKYGNVAMDLMLWTRKVRKGGVIAGHDYYTHNKKAWRGLRGVHYAVDGFVKTYDIHNWYVLGGQDENRQDSMDSELSFMIFKHWRI